MRTRFLSVVTAGALLAVLGSGCRTSGKPAIDEKAAAPSPAAGEGSPGIRSGIAEGSGAEAKVSPAKGEKGEESERKPYRVGDFLVYPLQWRNAEETAFRLYMILYPKYGPYLQIVPDPNTNSLLIYLPPESLRPTGGPEA